MVLSVGSLVQAHRPPSIPGTLPSGRQPLIEGLHVGDRAVDLTQAVTLSKMIGCACRKPLDLLFGVIWTTKQ